MENGAEVKVAFDVDALGDQIAEMSAHIDAAMHRLLTAIRDFDVASGWHVQGALSCAHWLAWRVGWDLRTARERVRVARKLADLPMVDEQLRLGAMSYSQARAISRVATAEKEHLWVAYAKRMPASQLDKLCRSYENVQAYDQAHEVEAGAMAAAHVAAQRTVTRRTLDNGMVKFEVVLPSDEAAIVWAALNAAIDTSSAEQTPAEQTPAEPLPAEPLTAKAQTSADRGRQRADAFMNIIQDRVRGKRPQRTPVEIIITMPHAGLHGSAEPSALAMMADGELIATSSARRLCCDAGVVVAKVDAQGVPLSVGRKTRTIPAAIKRALLLRDRTCRFPGCTHSRYVDGHHIEHWANGGETALANLMLLCSAHHTLLHEGGCRVEVNGANGAGGWNFFDHRNRLIDAQPARTTSNNFGARRGLAAIHDAQAELAITANTNTSKWTGEPIDYARCIDYLV
ncbi:MAG: DUF222 domain-containing protein [Kofleriaceae bacterium]|nr:DUF222 domain-containing protein [Kofleriaceae bacterium]